MAGNGVAMHGTRLTASISDAAGVPDHLRGSEQIARISDGIELLGPGASVPLGQTDLAGRPTAVDPFRAVGLGL